MHLLYYWTPKNYPGDMRAQDWFHLNQGAPTMQRVAPGESLWAFTRSRRGAYVLAAELVVLRTTLNNPAWTAKYGRYRVWGDARRSAYFNVHLSEDAEPVLRSLSVSARAKVLGRSFQGHAAVRALTQADHALLTAHAANQPLDLRVHPDQLRDVAAHHLGLERSLEFDLPSSPGTLREPPSRLPFSGARFRRRPALVASLQGRYGGRCQVCEWSPRARYGLDVCEGHHIQWLSRGGPDALDNLVLLCPNHHRAVHADDAVFDFEDLRFHFQGHSEGLRLNAHLERAR